MNSWTWVLYLSRLSAGTLNDELNYEISDPIQRRTAAFFIAGSFRSHVGSEIGVSSLYARSLNHFGECERHDEAIRRPLDPVEARMELKKTGFDGLCHQIEDRVLQRCATCGRARQYVRSLALGGGLEWSLSMHRDVMSTGRSRSGISSMTRSRSPAGRSAKGLYVSRARSRTALPRGHKQSVDRLKPPVVVLCRSLLNALQERPVLIALAGHVREDTSVQFNSEALLFLSPVSDETTKKLVSHRETAGPQNPVLQSRHKRRECRAFRDRSAGHAKMGVGILASLPCHERCERPQEHPVPDHPTGQDREPAGARRPPVRNPMPTVRFQRVGRTGEDHAR